jgi:hypothetical protein
LVLKVRLVQLDRLDHWELLDLLDTQEYKVQLEEKDQ